MFKAAGSFSLRNILISLVSVFFLSATLLSHAEDELLPPEQAFALKAWIENEHVIAEYDITQGYYLYRDSISFTLETDGVEFGAPSASDGKIKNDEFFGEVEVYRNKATISLPLVYNKQQKVDQISIKTVSQGCADLGVCYPPLHQSLTLDTNSSNVVLPVAAERPTANNSTKNNTTKLQPTQTVETKAEPAIQAINNNDADLSVKALDLLQSLGNDIGLNSNNDEIPSPDEAFQLSAHLDKNNIIQTSLLIHPNTYLYKDKTKINLVDGQGHETGAVALPSGDQKHDEFFGDILVFHNFLNVSIPVITETSASSQLVVSYSYQGCVEDKICYPPIIKYLLVDINDKSVTISDTQPVINQQKALSASTVEMVNTANPDDQQFYADPAQAALTQTNAVAQTEQDRFADIIADGDTLFIIGAFFIAGILLTFTPCVFPMIPILSGIIAGQGTNITTKKAFTLSLVYVLAMASTYAVAGAIVGYYGAEYNIQTWFQDPVILSVFAAIFVLLALSMFGFYDIQMPSFIQSRLTEFSNKQSGGDLIGVGIMGFLSALIVGPCITAPLVGALIFISQTQDWLQGGLALFALGLGMGTPLLLIGTSAGKLLPRAGTWMDAIKAFFGVGLLAVAIWLLERILATEIIMLLIALLLIVSGIYIISSTTKENLSGWLKVSRGIGFILAIYGLFYLIAVAAGGKNLIQPLQGIFNSNPVTSSVHAPTHIEFQQVKGSKGLQQALSQHKGKIVMFDFYADWCISCKEMEKYVFTDPAVLNTLKDVVSIQTDVTDNDQIDVELMSSLNIYGPPAILFYDRSGIEIPNSRIVGEMSADAFNAHVQAVKARL